MKIKTFQQTKFHLLLIVIITVLAYSNIFQNDFSTDDIDHVFNWKTNKEIGNIPKIFLEESVPPSETGAYRPIRALLLMGVYMVFGYNVFGYHLFSLTVYILSIILIYLITLEITRKKTISFLATLLFALHPIHAEAVTYIIASFDSAGFMFYLLAFWLYIRFRHSGKPRLTRRIQNLSGQGITAVRDSGVLSAIWRIVPRMTLLLSLFSALLAVLTYELAYSLPLAILLYEIILRNTSKVAGWTPSRWILRVLPFFVLYLSIAFFRIFIHHTTTRGVYLDGSFYTSILAGVKALAYYIYLFIFPINLSINHQIFEGVYSVNSKDYVNTETLKELSLFNIDILLSGILLIGLVVTAIFMFNRNRIVSFGIFWFFITLLPVSYLLPQIAILGERYAFLAAYGYVLLLALALEKIMWFVFKQYQKSKIKNQKYRSKIKNIFNIYYVYLIFTILFLISISAFYFYQTYQRNKDWKDTLTVWQVLVSEGPEYPLNNLMLARIHEEKKQYDQSLTYYNKLIHVDSLKSEVYYKIGLIYHRQERLDEAEKSYRESAEYDTTFASLSKMQLDKIKKFGNRQIHPSCHPELVSGSPSPSPSPARGEGVGISSSLRGEDKGEGEEAGECPSSEKTLEYSINGKVKFSYSGNWILQKMAQGAIIFSPLDPFFIELGLVEKEEVSEDESIGRPVNEGAAFIPNMDKAIVKIYDDKGIQKMLFFLYKEDLIIRALVYPGDSPLMREFDGILGSITIY